MARNTKRSPGRPRKASNALAQWIDEQGKTRDEVARKLDITRTHLDRLCRNDRRPDLELAFRIEDVTGGEVSARSWLRVPRHSED